MKFKGPENITSVSVGGECFNVGDDGLVETPDNGNYASLLAPHGFEQVAAAAEQAKAETAAEKKAREKAEKDAAKAAAAAAEAEAEAAKAAAAGQTKAPE